MSTQHDTGQTSTRALKVVTAELRERITTLEIEVAHWERTSRALSAELRALAPQCDHCQARHIPLESGGRR